MKLAFCIFMFFFGILLGNHEALGSGKYDAMISSLGALETSGTLQSATSLSRRRREILDTSAMQQMVNRMCQVASRLDASQWWAVLKCKQSSVRPPFYPGLIRGINQCKMQAFGNIESYWEYHKMCDLNEKTLDPRGQEVGKCVERWERDNWFELVMHAKQQRRIDAQIAPRVDQDAMHQCIADTIEFVDASDELIDAVVNLLATNG